MAKQATPNAMTFNAVVDVSFYMYSLPGKDFLEVFFSVSASPWAAAFTASLRGFGALALRVVNYLRVLLFDEASIKTFNNFV